MLAMEKKNKEGDAVRLWRKLEGRNRLTALAAESAPVSAVARELQRLQAYLLRWATYQKPVESARAESEIPLAAYLKDDTREASDWLGGSDAWAMAIVDTAIDGLSTGPDGLLMRAALRARYLNEGVSRDAGVAVRVFRSGRLQHMSLLEADALADRAEAELVPIVKRKGLPL